MSAFNPYEDTAPLAFAGVAKGFDFKSERLGIVDFPDDFVRDYVQVFENSSHWDETDAVYWPQDLGHGVLMFENILAPGDIFMTNKILEESLYSEEGAIIIPPRFYAVVECFDQLGEVYLTVNLVKGSSEYGKMYFWRKAHDELGTGDNTKVPVFASDSLGAFFAGLLPEGDAKVKLASRR